MPSVYGASVDISSKATIVLGCDKSCDVRIIDDIIVRCQQGHILQQVESCQKRYHVFDLELVRFILVLVLIIYQNHI